MIRGCRNYFWIWMVGMLFVGLGAEAKSRSKDVTLILVPREPAIMKFGLDMAARYPTMLLSYKTGPGGVSLHGWTGKKWVNVGLKKFQDGAFFKEAPESALIVEKSGQRIPAALIPPQKWCSMVSKISTMQLRPVIHLVGLYYDFNYKEWSWFSRRYGLPLYAINPDGENIHWYHRRMDQYVKQGRMKKYDDMRYWETIRQQLEDVDPPAVIKVDPLPVAPVIDPLEEDVQPAIIMDASPDELGGGANAPVIQEEPPEEDLGALIRAISTNAVSETSGDVNASDEE